MNIDIWRPTVPDHSPEISLTESQGGMA